MQLTAQQLEYLPAIDWFTSNERKDMGTGRTTALCYVLISRAIANPNTHIQIIDHTQSIANIMKYVKHKLIEMFSEPEFKGHDLRINHSRLTIVCHK